MIFEIDIHAEYTTFLSKIKDTLTEDNAKYLCQQFVEQSFLRKLFSEKLNIREYFSENALFGKGEEDLLKEIKILLSERVDNLVNQVMSKIDRDSFKNGEKVIGVDKIGEYLAGDDFGYEQNQYLLDDYNGAIRATRYARLSVTIDACKNKPVFALLINNGADARVTFCYANN